MEVTVTEVIHDKMAFIRSIKKGEKKVGVLRGRKEFHTMSVLISRVNFEESESRGYKIRSRNVKEYNRIEIYTEDL